MSKTWQPSYDSLLNVSRALMHGAYTRQMLQDALPSLRENHIRLALQELVRTGCAQSFQKAVPGKGFYSVYKHLHLPARKVEPDEEEPDPQFVEPPVAWTDALSTEWRMPVQLPSGGTGRLIKGVR